MATYNINKIKLPNGDIVKLVDETSGYAKSSEVPTVVDTYSSTGTDAVSGKAVNAALQTLDSSISATTNQAISAITITDGKIVSSSKIDVTPQLNWYGTCSTTASTAQKDVTCSGYTLNTGNIIGVLFSTANTAATPTLNVNSTGVKSIYIGGTEPNSTSNVLNWTAYTMIYFMYDGTQYRYLYASAQGANIPPRGANTWYGTSSTVASAQTKEASVTNFVLTRGALITITFSTANTYINSNLNLNINSTGGKTIYYNGVTTSSTNTLLWNANTTLTFMYDGLGHYHLIGADKPEPLGASSGVTIRTWS